MEVRPHDENIEKLVLGSIISNRNRHNEVKDILTDDCFYIPFYQEVFQIVNSIVDKGDEPDIVTILHEMKRKYGDNLDFVRIAGLSGESNIHVYKYTLMLADLSARRKLLDLGDYIKNNAVIDGVDISEIVEHIKTSQETLYQADTNSITTIQKAVKEVYDGIEQNLKGGEVLTGTPTGFEKFDMRSGGLQKSDLIIIGGESSHGKTSLALSMVETALEFDAKIAIYSLEMRKKQLAARLMSMKSGISSSDLLYNPLDDYKFQRLDKSINKLCNSSLYFDDRNTSNIDTIINSIRTMKAKYDIEGVVIDYLQILNVNMRDANEERQLATVARRLKNLAVELDIWVIAISQLNRDINPVPSMNRVRGSGQIFEAADIVIFVYQASKYQKPFPSPFENYETEGYAMIDVAKGRNIGTFKFLSKFEPMITKFHDIPLSDVPASTTNSPTPF